MAPSAAGPRRRIPIFSATRIEAALSGWMSATAWIPSVSRAWAGTGTAASLA